MTGRLFYWNRGKTSTILGGAGAKQIKFIQGNYPAGVAPKTIGL